MLQSATHLRKIKLNSPLLINTQIKISKQITDMTYFRFDNKFINRIWSPYGKLN